MAAMACCSVFEKYKDNALIFIRNDKRSDIVISMLIGVAAGIVMAFIKTVLCNNLSSSEANSLCKRIDDGNYPEIRVIEPDGMLIKKQQILDLQQDFSTMAVEGNKRIYIIRDTDKMRSETANSMLKFLEEPDNDIIAILMTNNYNNLLSTIISRCQVIRLNNDNASVNDNDFDNLIVNFIFIYPY